MRPRRGLSTAVLGAAVLSLSACGSSAPPPVTETNMVPEVASLPPAPFAAPNDLLDKDEAALYQALGTPGFIRKDEPAQVWRYESDLCLLDLFLYRQDTGFKVEHVELRPRQKDATPSPSRCFPALFKG